MLLSIKTYSFHLNPNFFHGTQFNCANIEGFIKKHIIINLIKQNHIEFHIIAY